MARTWVGVVGRLTLHGRCGRRYLVVADVSRRSKAVSAGFSSFAKKAENEACLALLCVQKRKG